MQSLNKRTKLPFSSLKGRSQLKSLNFKSNSVNLEKLLCLISPASKLTLLMAGSEMRSRSSF